jgi:hypothetical protein
MRRFPRTLGKLVLGETWQLPLGVAASVALAAVLRLGTGGLGWWRDAGGAVLAALLAGALATAVLGSTKRSQPHQRPQPSLTESREDPVNDVNKA